MLIDAPPIPSRLDLQAELRAVSAALTAATRQRHDIERAIRLTTDIEQLAQLHERWSEAIEQQAAAHDREIELRALLAD
jgi:hypothetical protein